LTEVLKEISFSVLSNSDLCCDGVQKRLSPSGLNNILTLHGLAKIPGTKDFLGGGREAGESSASMCK